MLTVITNSSGAWLILRASLARLSRDVGNVIVLGSPYILTLGGDDIVPKDGTKLQLGKYYVDGNSKTLAYS